MITVPISASSPYMKVTSYSDASAIGKKPTVSRSRNRSQSDFLLRGRKNQFFCSILLASVS